MRAEDKDLLHILARLAALKPDILVLQSIDYDHDLVALRLISEALAANSVELPFHFARLPNAGEPTPFDLDRNGRVAQARDKQGFGFFHGNGGLAILSRFPILEPEIRDFSGTLWSDLPDTRIPRDYFTKEEQGALKLHTIAAWVVPLITHDGRLDMLMSHAGPPVFDGPENRNGLRNGDEIRFWSLYLDGRFGPVPPNPFVLAATLNADPEDGEGDHAEITALLSHSRISDPLPRSAGSVAADDDPFDTVDWPEWDRDGAPGPGNLRVDYVLPSRDLELVASGVDWPVELAAEEFGTSHRAVWLDVSLQSLDAE